MGVFEPVIELGRGLVNVSIIFIREDSNLPISRRVCTACWRFRGSGMR